LRWIFQSCRCDAARRGDSCTGRTRLPAPGYEWGFSKEYWGVKVNDGGFHAYLEIYYPDIGWVFSDAEHSHHFVDPFHIILRLDGMEMPGSYKGGYLDVDKPRSIPSSKKRTGRSWSIELPLPKEKRLGRRLDKRQHSALVTGRVDDARGHPVQKGSVVLWKDGRGTPTPFVDGRFAVSVTNAGAYRVELRGRVLQNRPGNCRLNRVGYTR